MDLIVVGAGEITRELLKRLGDAWDVTVIDKSAGRIETLRGDRPFQAFEGDGSSAVVLRNAGLDGADGLVAASDEDDVNLEACRHARGAKIQRIMAVAAESRRTPEYRELQVPVLSPSILASREIENLLQSRRVTSKTFADGRIEAMEFTVAPNSPVRGMSIGQLNGRSMRVAAVLRRGVLVPPTDETELESADLVTVIGPATDLPGLVQTFTSGTPRFPLDFGKRVAVALSSESDLETTFREAVLVTKNSRATSLEVVHPAWTDEDDDEEHEEPLGADEAASPARDLVRRAEETEGVEVQLRAVRGRPERDLLDLPTTESIGLLVLRAPTGPFATWRIRRLLHLAGATGTPLLFARGRQAHESIIAAARRSKPGRAAARAAVDLAELGKARLLAVAVIDPEFIGGPRAREEAARAVEWVKAEAAVHGVDAEGDLREGNPVRAFLEISERTDLLVLGLSEGRLPFGGTLLTHLIRDAHPSILVVPARP